MLKKSWLRTALVAGAVGPLVLAAFFVFAAHVQLVHWADILYHDDPYLLHRVLENRPNYYLSQNPFVFYRETLYALMGRYSGYFLPKLIILLQAALTSFVFYLFFRRTFRFSRPTALLAALVSWVLPLQGQIFFGVNTSYIVFGMMFIGVFFLLIEEVFHKRHWLLSYFLLAAALFLFSLVDVLAFAYMPIPLLYYVYQGPGELRRLWLRVVLTVLAIATVTAFSFDISAPFRSTRDAGMYAAFTPGRFGEYWTETAAMFGYMSPFNGELVNQWGAHYVLGSWVSAAVILLAFAAVVINHRRTIAKRARRAVFGAIWNTIWLRDFRIMAVCLTGIVYFFFIYSVNGGPQARYMYPSSFFFGAMLAYALTTLLHLGLRPLLRRRYRHLAVGLVAAVLVVVGMTRKEAHARDTHQPEVFLYPAILEQVTPEQLQSYDGVVLHSRWVFVQHSGMAYLMYAKLWYAASRRYGQDVVIPDYIYIDSDLTCQPIFRGRASAAAYEADPWLKTQMGLERDKRYVFLGAHIDENLVFPYRYVANSDPENGIFEILDMSVTPTRVVLSAPTQDGIIAAVTQAGIDPNTISNMPEAGMTCLPAPPPQ